MTIFKTSGVCSSEILFSIEEGVVKHVDFVQGCPGSLMAVKTLVEGLTVKEVISKLKGIKCGSKETSCPDQLAKALEQFI